MRTVPPCRRRTVTSVSWQYLGWEPALRPHRDSSFPYTYCKVTLDRFKFCVSMSAVFVTPRCFHVVVAFTLQGSCLLLELKPIVMAGQLPWSKCHNSEDLHCQNREVYCPGKWWHGAGGQYPCWLSLCCLPTHTEERWRAWVWSLDICGKEWLLYRSMGVKLVFDKQEFCLVSIRAC